VRPKGRRPFCVLHFGILAKFLIAGFNDRAELRAQSSGFRACEIQSNWTQREGARALVLMSLSLRAAVGLMLGSRPWGNSGA